MGKIFPTGILIADFEQMISRKYITCFALFAYNNRL